MNIFILFFYYILVPFYFIADMVLKIKIYKNTIAWFQYQKGVQILRAIVSIFLSTFGILFTICNFSLFLYF